MIMIITVIIIDDNNKKIIKITNNDKNSNSKVRYIFRTMFQFNVIWSLQYILVYVSLHIHLVCMFCF